MTDANKTFQVQRAVEFVDTDAAGIVHFSAFFPMMESAEHALLRHLGLRVFQPLPDGSQLTWPRVATQCDYLGAARFEDRLTITPTVEHIGTKSVRYHFEISRDTTPIARGKITVVCCQLTPGGKLESIPIPADIRNALEKGRSTPAPAPE